MSIEHGKTLFAVAEKYTEVLDEAIPLSTSSKYEALLLSSSYLLSSYSQRAPHNLGEVVNEYYGLLENYAEKEGHTRNIPDIVSFNNERIQFFTSELNKYYGQSSYINGKMYHQIYESPLSTSDEMSLDMPQIMKFNIGLKGMLEVLDSSLEAIAPY